MYPNGNNNGRRALSPLILYGAVAVALLFALYLLISLFTAGFDKHFALVAGALLLLINARELLGGLTNRDVRIPLANSMVGLALVFVWLTALSVLFWLPALALGGLAVPLALNRATAVTYIGAARSAADRVQRSLSKVRFN
jgi:hypothetical protein